MRFLAVLLLLLTSCHHVDSSEDYSSAVTKPLWTDTPILVQYTGISLKTIEAYVLAVETINNTLGCEVLQVPKWHPPSHWGIDIYVRTFGPGDGGVAFSEWDEDGMLHCSPGIEESLPWIKKKVAAEHEMWHCIGADHVENVNDIMNPFLTWTQKERSDLYVIPIKHRYCQGPIGRRTLQNSPTTPDGNQN
jgi:hypothetical protein